MGFKYFYIKENEEQFDLDYFKSIDNLRLARKYISTRLKKIGQGSSREVYDLNTSQVIKIAKNQKGIAQNGVEGDYGLNNVYSKILPKLIDSHDEDIWIIVEKAEKITKKEFERLAKIPFETFCTIVSIEGRRIKGKQIVNPYSDFWDDEDSFVHSLVSMMVDFDMLSGDFEKINSFGKIGNKLVVVDCGFTDEVFKTHYR